MTRAQVAALRELVERPRSSAEWHAASTSVSRLRRLGYVKSWVEPDGWGGRHTMNEITPAGREALAREAGK